MLSSGLNQPRPPAVEVLTSYGHPQLRSLQLCCRMNPTRPPVLETPGPLLPTGNGGGSTPTQLGWLSVTHLWVSHADSREVRAPCTLPEYRQSEKISTQGPWQGPWQVPGNYAWELWQEQWPRALHFGLAPSPRGTKPHLGLRGEVFW